jgi:hypothetical protein
MAKMKGTGGTLYVNGEAVGEVTNWDVRPEGSEPLRRTTNHHLVDSLRRVMKLAADQAKGAYRGGRDDVP